jgi:hypothetical protein
MNFAREKCDERAMQGLMHNDAFELQFRNEPGPISVTLWRSTFSPRSIARRRRIASAELEPGRRTSIAANEAIGDRRRF